jgi:FkbM family methyltransferase
VEIGTSDRDTLDVELLPRLPSAFLVSFEPLIDKYARALARRKPSDKVKDGWEPLGMHHERGLILPMAVGPVSANASMAGELQSFHVARNAGCSSLLNINHAPYRGPLRRAASERAPQVFGLLCRPGAERRQVWVVPLSRALQWIGHQVDFLKVDAQGMDLRVVLSGGSLLRRHVRHMVLEVVGDECAPLYHGQPRCSHVVKRLAAEGFEPPTPVQCRTAFPFASCYLCAGPRSMGTRSRSPPEPTPTTTTGGPTAARSSTTPRRRRCATRPQRIGPWRCSTRTEGWHM